MKEVKKVLPSKKKIAKEKSSIKEKVLESLTIDVVPYEFSSYSLDQYKLYVSLKSVLNKEKKKIIQAALKNKGQTTTGKKDEILRRLLDGILLGVIPRCPYCSGGRPKYNQQNGSYICVGYRDDTVQIKCFQKFSFTDLPRTPWQE